MLWVTGYEIVVSFVKGLRSLYELGTHIHHRRERELVYNVIQDEPRVLHVKNFEYSIVYDFGLWPPSLLQR